jgi:ech hydrogenase subunit D
MSQEQFEIIPVDTLVEKVRAKKEQGCRFVQICCTRLPEQVELTYSFDLAGQMTHLRVVLPAGTPARVPSVSAVYFCSVLYENEIHDLFDVQVDGMVLDFKGNFYRTSVKFPFGQAKAAAPAAPAPAAPAAPAAPTTPATK